MKIMISIRTALVAVCFSLLSACGGSDDGSAPVLLVATDGISSIDAAALDAALDAYPLETISNAESASLARMREEEQLAHDVYAVSSVLYPQKAIFTRISDSEGTHSAAIKTLLDRYGLSDPLAGLANGSFATPAMQALYDRFVDASQSSLIAALQVGVEIEELDIQDLTVQMAVVDNKDILMVYGNLQRASRNHLRAFWKVLTAAGGTYTPKYLSQAEFDAIVNGPMETGG
jgi:hypothetical protein